MKYWKWLLLLPAVFLLCSAAGAAEAGTARAIILFEEDAALTDADLEGEPGVEVLWRYERLFSGAAVEADSGALRALRSMEGVAGVVPVQSRARPRSGGGTEVWSPAALELMGLEPLREAGYDGGGTVIAVVDSGLRTSHDAFADWGQVRSPALTPADIAAFADRGRTEGAYVSAKIPFAFDYYGRDDDVSTTDDHGTHVAGLAAGYVLDRDGQVLFRGAAPAAQLLAMKVFPDGKGSGADDAVILRALEDAWNLGADVINLSLGSGGGFTADGALDGLYCRAFAQLRESGVLLCCAAGNSGAATELKTQGSALPSAGYPDYGTVCSPAAYRGTLAVAAAEWDEERGVPVPAGYSSWGTTSDLRLVPALTAFGGPVLSAAGAGDETYLRESGTSMASGSAAGALAVLLQTLRERGVTDKEEAADLAERLLESTAQIMETGSGVPFSPRKQGAGLIDAAAAAASPLVVGDPLLELGEDGEGRFAFTLTLENLSEEDAAVELALTALTDAGGERDGAVRSLLEPRDITAGVALEGERSVTVPAGETVEIPLTLSVTPELRRELEETYSEGFFVEGYLTAETEGGAAVHAALLGFCGDWGGAPILDRADFRDAQEARFQLAARGGSVQSWRELVSGELGVNLAYVGSRAAQREDVPLLGENGRAFAAPDSRRNAIPGQSTDAAYCRGQLCFGELYTLRNAAHVVMVVSAGGEICYVDDRSWLPKSGPDAYTGEMTASVQFCWDGGDAEGFPLPDGTQARVDFFAWLDSDGEMQAAYEDRKPDRGDPASYGWLLEEPCRAYLEWSFPVAVDSSAPSISAGWTGDELTLTFRDNRHVAWASVRDEAGEVLFEDAFFPEEAGEAVTRTVDLSGRDPGRLYVAVEDYASNAAGYEITPEGAEPCAMALLTDVDRGAWYHRAVDFVWAEKLMDGGGELAFQPKESATRIHLLKALYRMAGSPAPSRPASALPFTDVPRSAGYQTALRWAWEQGLVGGYDETTFAGPANVTRQQLAVMLWRYDRMGGGDAAAAGDLSAFADGAEVSGWAAEAVSWAVGRGLLTGRSGGLLEPKGYTTRAEAAQLLMRYLEGQNG